MGIVAVYLIYLMTSLTLTVVTAAILTRSGKIWLTSVFGDETAGRAVAGLVVAGSTLLNLGFIVLAMRTSANVHGTRQAVELLSVKLGEVLLFVGTLYICSLLALARISRPRTSQRVTSQHPDLWRPATPRSQEQDHQEVEALIETRA